MKVAVLGWGSLIPKPQGLPLSGSWEPNGPVLKIEFSRISSDGRLTLVIDTEGSDVRTYYAKSARTELDDAICDLMIREGTSKKNIGTCSKDRVHNFAPNHKDVLPALQTWLDETNFDAVIWTDLASNYHKKRGVAFTESDAHVYLNSLSSVCRENAREYIIQAPPQTRTSFRKFLQSKGWL